MDLKKTYFAVVGNYYGVVKIDLEELDKQFRRLRQSSPLDKNRRLCCEKYNGIQNTLNNKTFQPHRKIKLQNLIEKFQTKFKKPIKSMSLPPLTLPGMNSETLQQDSEQKATKKTEKHPKRDEELKKSINDQSDYDNVLKKSSDHLLRRNSYHQIHSSQEEISKGTSSSTYLDNKFKPTKSKYAEDVPRVHGASAIEKSENQMDFKCTASTSWMLKKGISSTEIPQSEYQTAFCTDHKTDEKKNHHEERRSLSHIPTVKDSDHTNFNYNDNHDHHKQTRFPSHIPIIKDSSYKKLNSNEKSYNQAGESVSEQKHIPDRQVNTSNQRDSPRTKDDNNAKNVGQKTKSDFESKNTGIQTQASHLGYATRIGNSDQRKLLDLNVRALGRDARSSYDRENRSSYFNPKFVDQNRLSENNSLFHNTPLRMIEDHSSPKNHAEKISTKVEVEQKDENGLREVISHSVTAVQETLEKMQVESPNRTPYSTGKISTAEWISESVEKKNSQILLGHEAMLEKVKQDMNSRSNSNDNVNNKEIDKKTVTEEIIDYSTGRPSSERGRHTSSNTGRSRYERREEIGADNAQTNYQENTQLTERKSNIFSHRDGQFVHRDEHTSDNIEMTEMNNSARLLQNEYRDILQSQGSTTRSISKRMNEEIEVTLPPVEQAQEATEEPLQILDVHQYFHDFDVSTLDCLDPEERISKIRKVAGIYAEDVNTFDEEKYSLQYFVLDEKLMRLIEKLDKIRDDHLTSQKVEVIQYIKTLHATLDELAKDE